MEGGLLECEGARLGRALKIKSDGGEYRHTGDAVNRDGWSLDSRQECEH